MSTFGIVDFFSSFQGNELAVFLASIPNVTQFIERKFVMTEYLEDLKRALILWTKMFKFLGIARIEEGKEDDYRQKIATYKEHAKELYEVGKNSFLSDGINIGSRETFSFHVL